MALLVVLAGVTRYATGVSRIVAFVFATLALAGVAWVVSVSIEQVGRRAGPAVTGVLQASLANLPEFFVVIFALQAGHTVIAQTAILGSILVNALLVLGLVIVAGARRAHDGVMRFNPRLPNDTATLLLVASFIIILIGLTHSAGDAASRHTETISIVGSVVILVVYATWLRQYLTSESIAQEASEPPRLSVATSLVLLGLAGVAAAFVSDWFVNALEPTITKLHISQAFAGLVIVAIAGNAVENVAGIVLAAKGRLRARDLRGQELGVPDRRVPLPAARDRLVADRHQADVHARPGVHRVADRDRGDRVADHRRRRGDRVRGNRADRDVRDPRDGRGI